MPLSGKECTPVERVLLSCKIEVFELVEAAGVGILLGIESAQVTDFTFRENHHNCSNRRMGTRNTHASDTTDFENAGQMIHPCYKR